MCRITARRALIVLTALGSVLTARAGVAQSAIDAEHPAESAARIRIDQALDRIVNFSLNDTPLNEFVARLTSEQEINVELDHKALAEASIPEDKPLKGNFSGIRLRAALDLLLRGTDLCWVVRNESLLITTSDQGAKTLDTKVYPVRDLVLVRYQDGLDEDYDSLIDTITSTIAPSSWDSAGGAGSIAPFPNSSALVVSETRDVHEQIEQLLAALRTARDVQGIPIAEGLATRQRAAAQELSGGAFAAPPDADSEPPRRIHVAGPQPAWRVPQVYK